MEQKLTVQKMLELRARKKTKKVIYEAYQLIENNSFLNQLRIKVRNKDGIMVNSYLFSRRLIESRSYARHDFEEKTNITELEEKIYNNFLQQEIDNLEQILNNSQK